VTATPDGPTKKVALGWTTSTDDHEVYGYRISRDGKELTNVGADVTTFTGSSARRPTSRRMAGTVAQPR
jgi:hypothetical protein